MDRTLRVFLVGLGLVVVGVVVGFFPWSADGGSCGSAFHRSHTPPYGSATVLEWFGHCASALDVTRSLSWVLIVVGAMTATGAYILSKAARSR